MTTAQELGTAIYVTALEWVPRGGGIAEVAREGTSVLIYGRHPGGLRGAYHAQTCVEAVVSDEGVRAVVLGGRPGIPSGHELFTLALAASSAQDVANDAVARISRYLAATTS
mgnify:CR=1 FL=1